MPDRSEGSPRALASSRARVDVPGLVRAHVPVQEHVLDPRLALRPGLPSVDRVGHRPNDDAADTLARPVLTTRRGPLQAKRPDDASSNQRLTTLAWAEWVFACYRVTRSTCVSAYDRGAHLARP